MARCLRSLVSSSYKTLADGMVRHLPYRSPCSSLVAPYAAIAASERTKSPFDANIIRILRTEIDYQSEYAPPHPPAKEFKSFTVQDRPGELYITMNRKFGDTEDIKIEATMFDGRDSIPKYGEDESGEDVYHHISLIVDITKPGHSDLEFVCSAWPGFLEVQKVYMLRRDKTLAKHYMGPDFRSLDDKFQKSILEFLEARGVTDELSVFLHEYMTNKDRIELIRWLGTVKSVVEN